MKRSRRVEHRRHWFKIFRTSKMGNLSHHTQCSWSPRIKYKLYWFKIFRASRKGKLNHHNHVVKTAALGIRTVQFTWNPREKDVPGWRILGSISLGRNSNRRMAIFSHFLLSFIPFFAAFLFSRA